MKSKIYDYILMIILVLSIIFWLYRFYPYLNSVVPLWYDPGLYRRMFIDYFSSLLYINFESFTPRTRQAYPPYIWLMWNTFQIIWYNVDFMVTYLLAFFSFISSIFVYLILKKYSKTTAYYWIILFCISIIQYESFFLNYFKQIIWIIFLLVSVYLLEKKKYLLVVPIIISMFTINRPAGVYFVIMILFYVLYNYIVWIFKWNNVPLDKYPPKLANLVFSPLLRGNTGGYLTKILLTVLFSWIISLLMYLPLFNELIWWLIKPLTTTFLVTWNSGTFFSIENFIDYNWPIILLSFVWIYFKISKRELDFLSIWYIVWLLWVVLRLFFYSRFLIFLDLFIILLAAYGLWELFNKKNIFSLIFILFFWIQSYNYINYLNEYWVPFIPKSEFEMMNKLDSILPQNSMIMVTHKHYTSWLFWYTNKSIIAPWMLENDIWERSQWSKWWSSDWVKKCEMLKDFKIYKKEIYIWVWVDQPTENFLGAKCLETIYENWANKVMRVR